MLLFRQKVRGDWLGLFEDVRAELSKLLNLSAQV
jgi:hypothetical protein